MKLSKILETLQMPEATDWPDGILEGPFEFLFATELDYDIGAYTLTTLDFTAAAATCGSDLRTQRLLGTAADAKAILYVVGGRVEFTDAAIPQTGTIEGLVAEAHTTSLYTAKPSSVAVKRLPLGHHIGLPAQQTGGIAVGPLYSHPLPAARDFWLDAPWAVDFSRDVFAVEYYGGTKLPANTPVRARLYGVGWEHSKVDDDVTGANGCGLKGGQPKLVEAIRRRQVLQVLAKNS